nr:hypothetical protein [Tanacetum cinerariifolium]
MVTRGSGEPNMVEMDRVNIGEEDIVVKVCSDGSVMVRIFACKSWKESSKETRTTISGKQRAKAISRGITVNS